MIRRVRAAIEFVAADRALGLAYIDDLLAGVMDETPAWVAANDRVNAAEEQLPEWLRPLVDRVSGWWNKTTWIDAWDLEEQAKNKPDTSPEGTP
jgi:hypothetical protein